MDFYTALITLGKHTLQSNILLAPMAGITDVPMRKLCQTYGAGLTTAEMIASNHDLWSSRQSHQRLKKTGLSQVPHSIQIVGSDPEQMAEAANMAYCEGAEIIDINMGCPAKKVCRKMAGSALLGNVKLVENILTSVVKSVPVPVTLKIRTGTDRNNINARVIGLIAEDCGISMLTIHGRTRACRFNGQAEFDTIADVVDHLTIPVIANGDIDSYNQMIKVLDYTQADGIMVGRGIQGQPWLIEELTCRLQKKPYQQPAFFEKCHVIKNHLALLHEFYGQAKGIQIARKHLGWYLNRLGINCQYKKEFNQLITSHEQNAFVDRLSLFMTKGKVA